MPSAEEVLTEAASAATLQVFANGTTVFVQLASSVHLAMQRVTGISSVVHQAYISTEGDISDSEGRTTRCSASAQALSRCTRQCEQLRFT